MSDTVEVTQADRDAAALIYTHWTERWHQSVANKMKSGDYDGSREVQALVRHRIASTTAQQARIDELEALRHPIVSEIMAEVEKATRKFPTWPTRIIDAGTVVSEEAGELAKACLQVTYEKEKETLEGVRMEAIQTAAMCFRFLVSMDQYDTSPAEQHEQPALIQGAEQ